MRPRPLGPTALAWEVSGAGKARVVLDAGRGCAGLYLLTRDEAGAVAALRSEEAEGRARQALLLFRKHANGVRVGAARRILGERHLIVECGDVTLSLRLSAAPALTLAVAGQPLATLGPGRAAWPPPAADPQLPQDAPREPAEPTLWLPAPLADLEDVDFAREGAVRMTRATGEDAARTDHHPRTWREAFALFLELRSRGEAFAARRAERLEDARRQLKRLRSLERHLEEDARGLADPDLLRRQAEALLAAPGSVASGTRQAAVPDPYEPGRTLDVSLDPAKDSVANAEQLFARARRIARGRSQISARLAETRARRLRVEERLASLQTARRLADLGVRPAATRRSPSERPAKTGWRHYLTSRGLSLHVGRGARENHRLTFGFARPEDLWLHARDVPGAHVILRDDQGRAGDEDLREAAEVAAFFSGAAGERAVDVHCTRRKHLRPAKGGAGRVLIGHSETLRVMPKDPEGRLRRRY